MEIAIAIVVVLFVLAAIFRGAAAGGAVSCLGAIGAFVGALLFAGSMGLVLWAISPAGFWIAMVIVGLCIAGLIYWSIGDYRKSKQEAKPPKISDSKAAPPLKDLLKEATFIEARIHQHPDGTYLLVKEDGSLSAFRSLDRARLHRDDPSLFKPKTEAGT